MRRRGDKVLKDLFHKKRHYATIGTTTRRVEVDGREVARDSVSKGDNIPKGLVNKCQSCGALLIAKELEKNEHTCPHCGYHFPVDARTRIAITLDDGAFFEYDADLTSVDPLPFPGYPDKLRQAQEVSGLKEGVVTGEGTIAGFPVVIGVMDSRFIMGSMGSAVGEKIARAMERALQKRYPMILFTASGGARMQEGILSLMQMAKTSAVLEKMHEQGVLFISIITHPTTGGVSASFASLGDIILAEPGALFGFAGRRVIEQTIRQKLPDDFQTAEFMLKHGMIDRVVPRKELRATLATILRVHAARGWADGE
jgi:acetyl-CoA carboxylase carboxyl transferase subunit beta